MAEYSIGVDLGGTNLRAAAISRRGEIIEKISGPTELSEGRDAVIADMVESILTSEEAAGRRHSRGRRNRCPRLHSDGEGHHPELQQSAGIQRFSGARRNRAAAGEPDLSRKRCQCRRSGRKMGRRRTRCERSGAADPRHRDRRRHHLRWQGAARASGHGRRNRTHHRPPERQSLRLRKLRMP